MAADFSPSTSSSREAELQALLETLEQRFASETAASHAGIARLQTDQAKRAEADHRIAIAEQERASALQLEQTAAMGESIRRLESEKARLSERLLRDHGRGPCCVTKECSAAVAHLIQSDVPGGASPSGECGTCAAAAPEEGQPSASIRQATYFCSNGHACYCGACWTRKVRWCRGERRTEARARGCVVCAKLSAIPLCLASFAGRSGLHGGAGHSGVPRSHCPAIFLLRARPCADAVRGAAACPAASVRAARGRCRCRPRRSPRVVSEPVERSHPSSRLVCGWEQPTSK